ncbi:MAG: carbonic anhydrase [Deltaproteobacteria bacterium]|nr:carbonic anhydrase [Deltaproteobacteria bacterium]
MIPASEALERLRDGNRRFIANEPPSTLESREKLRKALATGQHPFAIVIGCSDSRVPPELIFDQELGDLFVVRVAGNVIAPSQLGSVEFAAESFGTRLVVVLGHSRCGAVMAALKAAEEGGVTASANIRSFLDRVTASVENLRSTAMNLKPEERLQEAVRANVRASANHLRNGSDVLRKLIEKDGLRVVGAEYSLESGAVTFID